MMWKQLSSVVSCRRRFTLRIGWFCVECKENHVSCLKRSLYGLKSCQDYDIRGFIVFKIIYDFTLSFYDWFFNQAFTLCWWYAYNMYLIEVENLKKLFPGEFDTKDIWTFEGWRYFELEERWVITLAKGKRLHIHFEYVVSTYTLYMEQYDWPIIQIFFFNLLFHFEILKNVGILLTCICNFNMHQVYMYDFSSQRWYNNVSPWVPTWCPLHLVRDDNLVRMWS